MDVEGQEPDPCAGYPGTAEQTSASTPTDSPQQRAALCSTMMPQEPLTCKSNITYGLFHTAATGSVCFFTFNADPAPRSTERVSECGASTQEKCFLTFCRVYREFQAV